MSLSRLGTTLLLAVGMHAGVLALLSFSAPKVSSEEGREASEVLVDLAPAAQPPSTAAAVGPSAGQGMTDAQPVARERPARRALQNPDVAPLSARETPPTVGSAPELVAGPETAPPESSLSPDGPRRPVDLGLDGHLFALLPPREPAPRRDPGLAFQRSLATELLASDISRGLARGGALATTLSSAVRDAGPTRGNAVLRVTVDAEGNALSVELVQGAESDWGDALKAFRERARRQRVRMPAGAAGLRITLNVSAKVQRASGGDAERAPVASEVGPLVLGGSFDLADLSGSVQRIVHARVVSEEWL